MDGSGRLSQSRILFRDLPMLTVPRTICLGFLVVISIGTLLLWLPISSSSGQWNDPIVALFTATSAVCVTGHIVVDTGSYFSTLGQIFILVLIQVGGLGYMTANTFLIVLLGRKFKLKEKMAIQQALDRQGMSGGRQMVRSIIATSLLFELTGMFFLWLTFQARYGWGQGLWLAIFHSISAWNNAGFSLFADNLIGYQSSLAINLIIPALIIFGGIGYEVIFEMYSWFRDRLDHKAGLLAFSLNFRIVTTTTTRLLVLGTIMLFLIEVRTAAQYIDLNFGQQFLAAWFQSVTARTAGFNTVDIGAMNNTALFLMIALMFIGGSPGGTAGGIKTTTIRLLAGITRSTLQGKEEVSLYERKVPPSLIMKAVAVTVGSMAVVILATIAISIADNDLNFIKILFEVVSGFATVGLSTGITADLSIVSKLILVITMYVGRVGILVLMAAIIGDPKPTTVHYPEENLLVG